MCYILWFYTRTVGKVVFSAYLCLNFGLKKLFVLLAVRHCEYYISECVADRHCPAKKPACAIVDEETHKKSCIGKQCSVVIDA